SSGAYMSGSELTEGADAAEEGHGHAEVKVTVQQEAEGQRVRHRQVGELGKGEQQQLAHCQAELEKR
uniref:Histone H3 n=1 Tax=Macrostomum lignano TaxID=282301 RepID=A0A1I8IYE5_9PLAT